MSSALTHNRWILSIDTAMGACSAGAYDPISGRSAAQSEIMPYGQAERLLPLIGEVLQKADIVYADLGAIMVTPGPGSFAGLRVGLATAKGLALALGIPLYGLSTFQALAFRYVQEAKPSAWFAAVIDTRRDDFYIQIFDAAAHPVSEMLCLTGAQISALIKKHEQDVVMIGDGASRLAGHVDCKIVDHLQHCDPVINAVALTYASNLFVSDPEPLYLRGADVSKSKTLFRQLKTDL